MDKLISNLTVINNNRNNTYNNKIQKFKKKYINNGSKKDFPRTFRKAKRM